MLETTTHDNFLNLYFTWQIFPYYKYREDMIAPRPQQKRQYNNMTTSDNERQK